MSSLYPSFPLVFICFEIDFLLKNCRMLCNGGFFLFLFCFFFKCHYLKWPDGDTIDRNIETDFGIEAPPRFTGGWRWCVSGLLHKERQKEKGYREARLVFIVEKLQWIGLFLYPWTSVGDNHLIVYMFGSGRMELCVFPWCYTYYLWCWTVTGKRCPGSSPTPFQKK